MKYQVFLRYAALSAVLLVSASAMAADKLYVIGNIASAYGNFNADQGIEMTSTGNRCFRLTTSFHATDNAPVLGFTTSLGNAPADMAGLNAGRLVPAAPDGTGVLDISDGGTAKLATYAGQNSNFILSNGTYTLTVDLKEMTVSAERNAVSLAGDVDGCSWSPERGHGMHHAEGDVHVATVNVTGDGYFTLAGTFGDMEADFNASRLGPLYGDEHADGTVNSHHSFSPDWKNEVSATTGVTSGQLLTLSTDKARYNPGETVKFTADAVAEGATVRYRHLSRVVAEHPMNAAAWTWQAPAADCTGYLIDIYTRNGDSEKILGTIAVDVSSDWIAFPRYGFVANFDRYFPDGNDESEYQRIKSEMEFLNRCHINGVQFQDWHWKHHRPVAVNADGSPMEWYRDIAKHWVSRSYIKRYIDEQHSHNMKAIFYNLAFGALGNPQEETGETSAAEDGVKKEWYCYRSADDHSEANIDKHILREWGKSDIYLVNPGNPEWQEYLGRQNDLVYANFDFDGFQIDQLGNRGALYAYDGEYIDLGYNYLFFIDAMKKRHPEKRLVMNAVSRYGSGRITGSGKIDFCYNEVWGNNADGSDNFNSGEQRFAELLEIIHENDALSQNRLRTVFAAYMNYKKADNEGYFNTPGILLTDAAIFAIGGTHLELGGNHMLCKEYFPNSTLRMSDGLTDAIIRYYDFATAYENLLMTPSTMETTVNVAPTGMQTVPCGGTEAAIRYTPWTIEKGPKARHIVTYSKNAGARTVISFLNFMNVDRLSWRDAEGTMPEPAEVTDLEMIVESPRKVSKVWAASPDYHGGAPVEVSFRQEGSALRLTLPHLKYWTMLVLE